MKKNPETSEKTSIPSFQEEVSIKLQNKSLLSLKNPNTLIQLDISSSVIVDIQPLSNFCQLWELNIANNPVKIIRLVIYLL